MKLKIGAKIALGYAVILTFMLVISAVVYVNVNQVNENFDWVVHTDDVLRNAEQLKKLVVDMETGQRGFVITGKDNFLEPFHNGQRDFARIMKAQKKLVDDNPKQVARLVEIERIVAKWKKIAAGPEIAMRRKVVKGEAKMKAAIAMILAETGKNVMDKLRIQFESFIKEEVTLMDQRKEATASLVTLTQTLMLFLTGLAIIIGGLVAYLIIRSITRPLKVVVDGIEKIAKGDLTVQQIEVKSKDEIGILGLSFNQMSTSLKDLVLKIQESSRTLSSTSTQFSSVGDQLASSANQMAEQASTSASGAQEMINTINEVAKSADKAASITKEVAEMAEATNTTVEELGSAAKDIGKIVNVIVDIADQTNLLSLNASIEAAGAGEAGKGFAIVANEVKELARQTAKATEDIREKIEGIQGATDNTIKAITETTESVKSINEITTNIASSVEEQSITTKEIARNVSQVADGAKGTAEGAETTQKTSAELSDMATNLGELVGAFKV